MRMSVQAPEANNPVPARGRGVLRPRERAVRR